MANDIITPVTFSYSIQLLIISNSRNYNILIINIPFAHRMLMFMCDIEILDTVSHDASIAIQELCLGF